MSLDAYHNLTHAKASLGEARQFYAMGGLEETMALTQDLNDLDAEMDEEQRALLETCAAEDSGPVLEVLQSELGRRGGARMQGWRVDLMIQLEEREAEPHPSLSDAARNEGGL